MDPFEWECPFCNKGQVATENNFHSEVSHLWVGMSKYGDVGIEVTAIRCVNPECNEVIVQTAFGRVVRDTPSTYKVADALETWFLRPESSARPQPEYIPAAIREDYREACLIRDKSPKAAATLARRCLQGMIRDFCNIKKARLIDEINELRRRLESESAPKGVEAEAIDAIDAVRKVGNIGAHMEADIDLIVEVDPGEAQALIELIEMLFEDWYVARHNRQGRLARVQAVAADKTAAIKAGKAQIAHKKALAITDKSGAV